MSTEKKVWSSFAGYRKFVGSCLRAVPEIPKDLIQEVEMTDYEGCGVASELYSSYECAEDYLEDMKRFEHKRKLKSGEYPTIDPYDFWCDAVGTLHDLVIDMICEYRNPWNYAPNTKAAKFDKEPQVYAREVEKVGMKKQIILSDYPLHLDNL